MNIIVRNEVVNNKAHPVNQDDDILYINKAHKQQSVPINMHMSCVLNLPSCLCQQSHALM